MHSIIHHITRTIFFFVDGFFFYAFLGIICAGFLLLLKRLGCFDVKNPKLNEKLAEADTDFYRKSVNFAVIPESEQSDEPLDSGSAADSGGGRSF
jgi:hypothetical protein